MRIISIISKGVNFATPHVRLAHNPQVHGPCLSLRSPATTSVTATLNQNFFSSRSTTRCFSVLSRQGNSVCSPFEASSCNFIPCRHQQMKSDSGEAQKGSSLAESSQKSQGEVTVGAKVAQAGKDAAYGSVVLVGVGVTLVMFYAIGRELFSGSSESGLYGRAFKMVKNSDDVYVALGSPLKAYGEANRRGRRRHVQSLDFVDQEGNKYTRLKFYIEGPSGKADVHCEARHEKGGSEFRYIFVEAPNQRRPIIVLDNR